MGRLDGRSVVVTGVGSGLGRAIAQEFAAEGAFVLGCDIDDDAGRATMAASGYYHHADVAIEGDVEALVQAAVARWGRLDVIVNNAAINVEAELAETTEALLDRVLAVNLKGVFFGCKHAVRAMKPAGGGVIVNIASILALVGDGVYAAYCAAKGGVLGITRATAARYGVDGIRCNAICPGDIDTPMLRTFFETCEDPIAARHGMADEYPLRRIADPREIARSALFLASDDSSFMTGQPLVVDGGLTADCY